MSETRRTKFNTDEERINSIKESKRKYAQRNREKAIENLRTYYDNNREKINERNRLYRARKKEELNQKLERLALLEDKIKEYE